MAENAVRHLDVLPFRAVRRLKCSVVWVALWQLFPHLLPRKEGRETTWHPC